MASYINPADLILPYLQPLIGSVNTGIEQGLKLGTLQQAINKEKMLLPYYKAHTALYNAQAAEKVATEEAFKRIIAEGGGGVAGPMTPERALLLHKAGLASPQSWLPTINPVEAAGGVQVIERATGASQLIPTPGLPPAQKVENIVSGDTTQSVLVDRSGQTSPVMLPRTAAVSPESALNPADFIFGRDIPGPAEDVGMTAALPGPRFAPKADKDTWSEPYAGPDGSMLQENLTTGQVRSVIGREPKRKLEEDIVKSANLNNIIKIQTSRFLEFIPEEKKKSILAEFAQANLLGGSLNPAIVRDALPDDLKKAWDSALVSASKNGTTMAAPEAFEQAWALHGLDSKLSRYKAELEQKRNKELADDAEKTITAYSSDKRVEPNVEVFNRLTTKPYTYEWEPGVISGGKWAKKPKAASAGAAAPQQQPAPSSPGPSGMSKTSQRTETTIPATRRGILARKPDGSTVVVYEDGTEQAVTLTKDGKVKF